MAALFIWAKNGEKNKCLVTDEWKNQKRNELLLYIKTLFRWISKTFYWGNEAIQKRLNAPNCIYMTFLNRQNLSKEVVFTWGILPSPSSDGAGDISWLSPLGEWGLGGCFCYVVDTEAGNAVKHSRIYRTLTQQRIISPKIPIVPRPRLENLSTVVSDGLGILNANENEGVLGTIKMFYILFVILICSPKFTTLYTSNGHILLYATLPQS